ncbi:MAG: TolC family protein [Deltaproteobacteria bacterium]|nr:MAG: TolC family protein [Deltaproteobacteria bacterium]
MRMLVTLGLTICGWLLLMLASSDSGIAAEQGVISPQPTPELRLSLRDAMEAALDNNPNVRLFREKIAEAHGVARTQLGALLPNVSTSVRQSQQTFFLGTLGLSPSRTDPFSIFDARGNMSQSLFSMSLIQRWRASREGVHVAELESDTTKNDTMAATGLLYMEALKAEAMVRSREANLRVFNELLELARGRRGGGMATGLDTARVEAQRENERQQLAVARYEVERVKLNLIHVLGISFDIRLTLTDDFLMEVTDAPAPQEALATAMATRAEVKSQAQRIKAASISLSSTVSERLPSLSAQGDYGLIGNRMNNTLDTYNVALLLSIPIFDGGQREGRISESRSLVQQEMIRMQLVTNKVTLEVREALVTLASAKEQLGISQAGLKAAITELGLARERFTILTASSNLEVTNALFSMVRARDNVVDAMFRLNAARVNLARALGQLDTLH